MEVGETLRVTTRAAWRAWLKRHHAKKREVWLVYPNKASGRPRIPYNDAVDEAICFGWIDSIVKKVSPDEAAQRFTPRRKGSPISELNQARARRMMEEGRMTPAGLASLHGLMDFTPQGPVKVAPDIRRALKAEPGAWANYEAFPETYRRIRIAFIEGARSRPEVFETRLRYFVRMTAKGKRYGMLRE